MQKKIIALIDNYDSFTYNIYQMLSNLIKEDANLKIQVFRNDEITVEELEKLNLERLIISPGPGIPVHAGISVPAIQAFAGKIPILGICLGHQSIAEAFGGKIIQAKAIVHGKVEAVTIDGKGVLRNLPNPCHFTRYHSLAVDSSCVPSDLEISAHTSDGEIMGLRHKKWPIEGVQFHPESIGSEFGERFFANFLHWRRNPLDRKGLLNKIVSGLSLQQVEASSFMDELTDGALDDVFIAGILMAMAAKGYSSDELAGCVSVLKKKCRSITHNIHGILDTCGTGGDGKHSFNISSFSALIATACGATVAKHGNRSVSSQSGSTDFFNALGISTHLDPESVVKFLNAEGFAYMAAPLFHSAMKYAAPVRKALGVKTIMNCLGPLANPIGADYQLIGVFDASLLPVMARAAKSLGVKRVMCVHSEDGLDEISPAAKTKIFMIDEQGCDSETLFDPASVGVSGYHVDQLIGGDAAENACIANDILRGYGSEAIREAVCLNTGAALYVAERVENIAEGYQCAKSALESGAVAKKVESLRKNMGFQSNK